MQDVDMEPAPPSEPEPTDPAIEGLYPAIDKLKEVAISAIEEATKKSTKAINKSKRESINEIKKAQRESTILSYRMLIAGAVFGFLGSFFVATLLRWFDAGWVIDINNKNFWLGILGPSAFIISGYFVYCSLKKAEHS